MPKKEMAEEIQLKAAKLLFPLMAKDPLHMALEWNDSIELSLDEKGRPLVAFNETKVMGGELPGGGK